MWIIYKATNTISGKPYVGQTVQNLRSRWNDHLKRVRKGKHQKIYFYNAIHKHGIDNFNLEILKECDTKEVADIMETFCIVVHKSHISEGGYNMTWGGEGTIGYHHTNETKKKLSGMKMGVNLPPFTEEHKQKIGESNRNGKRPSVAGSLNPSVRPEVRERINEKMRRPETRMRISEKLKGRIPWNKGMKKSNV